MNNNRYLVAEALEATFERSLPPRALLTPVPVLEVFAALLFLLTFRHKQMKRALP